MVYICIFFIYPYMRQYIEHKSIYLLKLCACQWIILSSADSLLQTVWTQMKTNRMSILIWIQTVWHCDVGPGWFIFLKKN